MSKTNSKPTKAERKQMVAYDCEDCFKYYASLGLSEEEIRQKMNKCSRHRNQLEAEKEKAPDSYWDLDFPTTPEIKRRNMMKDMTKKAKN